MGLPRRPLPPRGSRLRAVRSPGLGAGPTDRGATRRPVRARHRSSCSSSPTTSSTTSPSWRREGARTSSRSFCAFDVVANNADRKSGHVLFGSDGRLWGIDHGLCFHVQHKLRTVIWDFAGEEVPAGSSPTSGDSWPTGCPTTSRTCSPGPRPRRCSNGRTGWRPPATSPSPWATARPIRGRWCESPSPLIGATGYPSPLIHSPVRSGPGDTARPSGPPAGAPDALDQLHVQVVLDGWPPPRPAAHRRPESGGSRRACGR